MKTTIKYRYKGPVKYRCTEHFSICPGILVSIYAAHRIIQKNPRRPITLPVRKYWRILNKGNEVKINLRHAKWGTLKDKPVFVVKFFGKMVLFDGWHRIWRAHRSRRRYVNAYVLTTEEMGKCLRDSGNYKKI